MAELFDFLIDIGILFDIRVGGGNISLRLVIIVIGDKIFYSVMRKKFFKFPVKLGCQRFIVRDDQRRFLYTFYDVGHRKSLSRSRNAQKRLMFFTVQKSFRQFFHRLRLISCQPVIGYEFKSAHAVFPPFCSVCLSCTVSVRVLLRISLQAPFSILLKI